MKLPFVLLSFLFCLNISIFGQTKPSYLFTEEDGLANNSVRAITKDNNGYLWIGTDNGISIYNGSTFKTIIDVDDLPSRKVWSIAMDESNNTWVACYGGGLVKISNNKIDTILYLPLQRYSNSFRKLHYSKQYKTLLIGTDYGLYQLKDYNIVEIKHIKETAFKYKSSILSISEKANAIFFTVHSGKGYGGLFKLSFENTPLAFQLDSITKFASEFIGNLVYSNYYSDYRIYDTKQNTFIDNFKLDNGFLAWDMTLDNSNKLWLVGWGGSKSLGDIKIIDTENNNEIGFKYKKTHSSYQTIYHDATNSIMWVGSQDGLFAFAPTVFEYYDAPRSHEIGDIEIDSNNSCYILTNKSLYIFNKNFQKIYNNSAILNVTNSIFLRNDSDGIKNVGYFYKHHKPSIQNIEKHNDKIFAITNKGSLSIPNLDNYLPYGFGAFLQDNKGGIYYAREYDSLYYYKNKINPIKRKVIKEEQGNVLDIIKAIKDNDVYYFASETNGLYAVKNDTVYYLNELNSTLDNNLSDIELNNKGEVWCTSTNGNLYNISFSDSLFIRKQYDHTNGIIGETIKWLKFNDNNLYLGTDLGLNIIAINSLVLDQLNVHFYNKHNGYNYVATKNPAVDSEGNIYLHTLDKLIKINNEPIQYKLPILTVSDILINNTSFTVAELNKKKLKHTQNNISLKFIALKYPSSKNIEYRYQLNNNKWSVSNIVNLQALSPNNYSLKLEAFNLENGITQSESINFIIRKPIWSSVGFALGLILISVLITIIIYQSSINRYRTKQNEKDELNKLVGGLRIKSLQQQMNPHFIFNTLNSIQNFILTGGEKEALQYLAILSNLIRGNLENLASEFILLNNEIDFISKYLQLEKLRLKDKLNYEINNEIEDNDRYLIPPMIIQPIIENAIKHGIRNLLNSGTLIITIKDTQDSIQITIKDNGIGRKKAATLDKTHSNGKGLQVTSERILLLNSTNNTHLYSINFYDLETKEKAVGTLVKIQLKKVLAELSNP